MKFDEPLEPLDEPDILPQEIVTWQPTHHGVSAPRGQTVVGAALGAVAVGALAFGALALGALAIGYLSVGRARIGRLQIDRLVIGKLDILDRV